MKLKQEQVDSLRHAYAYTEGDTNQRMEALIDAYEKMRPSDSDGWISVKERLPKFEDAYNGGVEWWDTAHSLPVIYTWTNECRNKGDRFTHWKRIIPPVITPPTLEEVERPKFEEWIRSINGPDSEYIERHGHGYRRETTDTRWEAWLSCAQQFAKLTA